MEAMQKLINDPADAVVESLQGLQLAYPHLVCVHLDPAYVRRRDAPVLGKVAVLSGSGSGHEPLDIGYVGKGMLDAACPGPVFTSPTPDQFLAATAAVDGGVGTLYIVKNYAGGVMNAEAAMELAEASGYQVRSVLIHDDVAVELPSRRRGTGAAVLAAKLAGAAAEAGYSLDGVTAVAQRVSEQARSMGVALSSCTSPGLGRPTFQLPKNEMEVGIGIHGEQGRKRVRLANADTTVDMLLEPIAADLALRAGDLLIAFRHMHQWLTAKGIHVERQLVGNYITSLDMAGCTLTVLRLDDELLRLWDAPVHTPTLTW
jgi:dihydroxyacetone kinase-like protein